MRVNGMQSLEAADRGNSGDMKENVYFILKKMIMKREFTPNERLDVNEIALKLGNSRTPVRDAINKLEAEGFVRTVARKGTFVTGIYREDLIELFQYRQMIELFCMDLGFSKLQQSADLLQNAIRNWEAQLQKEEYDGSVIMETDVQFHSFIVQSAGNSKMIKSYNALNCHVQTARGYYLQNRDRINSADREHQALLSSIMEGDKEKSKQMLEAHLNSTLDSLLKIIDVFKVF